MFFSVEAFLDIIRKTIRFDNIRQSKRVLSIATTDWDQGTLQAFCRTDRLGPRIVQASAALPGFFPSVSLDDQSHVDAGVLGYAALFPAIDAGADTLQAVYLDTEGLDAPLEKVRSTLDAMHHVFVTIWGARTSHDLQTAEKLIQFRDELDSAIEKGRLSAAEALQLMKTVLSYHDKDPAMGRTFLDKKVGFHRHYPPREYGSLPPREYGSLSVLETGRKRLEGIIEQGYNDAVHHDCKTNRCVLPTDP